jgi:hypothetical protein
MKCDARTSWWRRLWCRWRYGDEVHSPALDRLERIDERMDRVVEAAKRQEEFFYSRALLGHRREREGQR